MRAASKSLIRKNLMELISIYPDVKCSRNLLVAEYWKHYDGATLLDDIISCTPAESITREFRKMVSDNLIALDMQTKLYLEEKDDEFRTYYGDNDLASNSYTHHGLLLK